MQQTLVKLNFFEAPKEIFELAYLSEHAKMVLFYLISCNENDGQTYEDIAYKCSIGTKTAYRALKELSENNLISKVKGGAGVSCTYAVNLELCEQESIA